MNAHHSSSPPRYQSIIISLILLATLSTIGGFLHVYYKNEEIQTMRKIDESEKAISQLKLEIRALEMQADQQLNRYALKEKLARQGSSLIPIPIGLVEPISTPEQPAGVTAMNP
jgi:hypothetical protein